MLDEDWNIEIKEANLDEFTEIIKNYLRLSINYNEINPPVFDLKVIQDNNIKANRI